MALNGISDGFDVFLQDGDKAFGAVRLVRKDALVVYVENAGDFEVPADAVRESGAGKVVLDSGRLSAKLREAIRRAHMGEDPNIP